MGKKEKEKSIKADLARPRPALFETWLEKNERWTIVTLCLVGAFRILIFSAAFPFFSQVDEHAHFDLIYKYAYEHIPQKLENFSLGSSRLIGTLGSPEFIFSPAQFADNRIPPPWWTQLDSQESREFRKRRIDNLLAMENHESNQPPVYYLVTAQWYRLGKLMGLNGAQELYWIRFLGVISFALFVWLAAACAKELFPGNSCLRFGIPILAAFFPQDVLYTLNNDVLSPLLFGWAFYLLVTSYTTHFNSSRRSVLAGITIACAFLNKDSNIAVLALPAALAVLTLRDPQRRAAGEWRKVLFIGSIASIPIILRFARNLIVLGDLSGSAEKVKSLGWTVKPILDMWNHPIFSPGGLVYFWNGLLTTFWRGEIFWHKAILASAPFDLFYALSSLAFLTAAAYSLRRNRLEASSSGRLASRMSLLVTAVSIVFLAVLSMIYDFGACVYPSREHPFFVSGRLILGVLLPFLILYLQGLDFILAKLQWSRYRMALVLFIALAITLSEIGISLPVFASAYNWFHIPSGI